MPGSFSTESELEMRKKVHIISHSHWDREWYMPFEQHRVKLLKLIDDAMELFENDERYENFHLDGQTIVLDDYLEIKPENAEQVKKHIAAGHFHVGPWYILQDEFLTSGESNVRNLLVGRQEAKKYGDLCRVGYFPDAFGNAGQMPQLLKQAGMEAIVFGRGVKPVGFNNQTLGGEYESAYSEMIWESPDGSSLPGILFANWYNNGSEIPVEKEAARKYWDERLAKAEKYAGTSQLLFMNGCDHQPVQKDLGEALETARELYPEIDFIHSDFETYVQAVKEELKPEVSHVQGELTSQETDGCWTLVNTTSSRIDLKVRNRECETQLENRAEPLGVMAARYGMEYPRDLLRYSWKTLMQNHPHDSICGCSVDAVNREMKTRFDKSFQTAEVLCGEALTFLAEKADTSTCQKEEKSSCVPFVVFNTSGWERSGVVRTVLELERSCEGGLQAAYESRKKLIPGDYCVKDAHGNPVDARCEDLGVRFDYDLPDDRFRDPYMARNIAVTMEAADVPAFGCGVYYLQYRMMEADEAGQNIGDSKVTEAMKQVETAEAFMENQYLKVQIHEDGTYSITNCSSGHCYERLGWYEETGDIGNEYIYVQAKGDTYTTKGVKAEIRLMEKSAYRTSYEIRHQLEVPACADETFQEEKAGMKALFERTAGRSSERTTLSLITRLTLERSGRGLQVETEIDNTAKDHRIRVMLPTGLRADSHYADSNFEVVKRRNHHGEAWKNPSGCEHQQNFVAMQDEKDGLLAANFGLYEYEVLPEQENTIAVTLLRCIGEMGDWGVFPTPEAQLPGKHKVRYEIVPYEAQHMSRAFQEGYQFQNSLMTVQTTVHPGSGELSLGLLHWEGEGLQLTGCKCAEEGQDVILRFVNQTEEAITLHLEKESWFSGMYQSNVIEQRQTKISAAKTQDGKVFYGALIRPHEIATFDLTCKDQSLV